MSEIAAVIVACAGLITVLGGGAKFLWDKIEARFVQIDAKLAACETREDEGKDRAAKYVTVIELLWQEVERISPDGSNALTRAGRLLATLKKDAD